MQSHYAKVQADLYGSMAVSVAASRIALATSGTNAGGTKTWWVSQPGRIAATPFATNSTEPKTQFVALSSGTAASVEPDVSVDLNPAALTRPEGLIAYDTSTSLPVKWVYVHRDGTQSFDPTAAPAYVSGSASVVGRYAFWVDDESSRININAAASSKTPENEVAAHPSKLDLTVLSSTSNAITAADIQSIREARDKRPFDSLEEIKAADPAPAIATALSENKLALTHYSQSPDLNRFGEPRIVLTTQKSLLTASQLERSNAGEIVFFDILKTDNADPGILDNVDKDKIEKLFDKLYPYFEKRACDWGLPGPVTYNKTLVLKYGGGDAGKRTVAQIILNLIDYVRSVESPQTLVLPVRGAYPATAYSHLFDFMDPVQGGPNGSYMANGILGNSRRLHIVEMGIWLPAAPVSSGIVKAKLFLPATVGGNVNLVGLPFQYVIYAGSSVFKSTAYTIKSTDIAEGDPVIQPGQYRTLTINAALAAPSATRPQSAVMRMAIKAAGDLSYDIVPVYDSSSDGYAHYKIDDETVAVEDMTSISTNDPAVSQCWGDWQFQGPNTFGTSNRPAACKLDQTVPTPTVPQQDTDSGGRLTDVSTRPPALKGSSDNPLGIVGSVGEIGRVHSGGRGGNANYPGTPWRSLRLQPRLGGASAIVPDWLLLDLFTVPLKAKNAADEAVLHPFAGAAGGRINLNTRPYPFPTTQLVRDLPLRAVLQSVQPALTGTAANPLIFDILDKTLANGINGKGIAFGTSKSSEDTDGLIGNKLYLMPGEICEIKGIADSGEASESMVRGMLGLLTTNSNVFSVFAVSQKILQLPSGKINVLSESRTRTLLERQEDGRVHALSTTELGL